MEIKEINYHDRLPKTMNSRFNYFVKDFLKEYSDQLDKLDSGSNMSITKEYDADLEVYFVKFLFSRLSGSFNELFVSCNGELWGTVILE